MDYECFQEITMGANRNGWNTSKYVEKVNFGKFSTIELACGHLVLCDF